MDFSIAARGYGLGIALLVWAVHASLHGRPIRSGFLLGFGIAANLTIVFPATGLIAAHLAAGRKGPDQGHRCHGRCGGRCCHGHLLLSLSHRHSGALLRRATFPRGFSVHLDQSPRFAPRSGPACSEPAKAALFIGTWIVPAFALFCIVICVCEWQKGGPSGKLKVPLALALTVASLLAAHFLFKLNYPGDRTGLYLVPLAGITWATTADMIRNRSLRAINLVVACVLLIQFATQVQFRYFEIWRFNSAIKDIAQQLRQETRDRPAESVSLSTNFTPAASTGVLPHLLQDRRAQTGSAPGTRGFHWSRLLCVDRDWRRAPRKPRALPSYSRIRSRASFWPDSVRYVTGNVVMRPCPEAPGQCQSQQS